MPATPTAQPNQSRTSTIQEFASITEGRYIPTEPGAPPKILGFVRNTSRAQNTGRYQAEGTVVHIGGYQVRHGVPWLPVVRTGERPADRSTNWTAIPDGHNHLYATTGCALCDMHLDPNCMADDFQGPFRDSNFICWDCFTSAHRVYDFITGRWIERTAAVWNSETRQYANREWARNNWHFWPSLDEWRSYQYTEDYEDGPRRSASGPIMVYHTNALDYVDYDADALQAGRLVYGVELEMEAKVESDSAQLAVANALHGPSTKDYILTRDGSLNYGVELVSAPRTLLEHQRSGLWTGVHTAVASIAKSGAGTTRCGMHVHINRRALSPLTLGKMLVFFNDDKMDSYIKEIAQRSNNGYSKKKNKDLSHALYQNDDRYERLNMSSRTGTVEVRIFRGNLKPQRILKNIEFVDAAVNYCKRCSMRDAADWSEFSEWLRPQTSVYPNLIAFLKERQVLYFAGYDFSRAVTALVSTGTEV